jgi:PPM family protein phosphatase
MGFPAKYFWNAVSFPCIVSRHDKLAMLHKLDVMEVAALTDVGRVRSANEDAYGLCAEAGFFVVCDGMGGAAAGEVASNTAATTAIEALRNTSDQDDPRKLLEETIAAANLLVFTRSEREPALHGMGTTLVSLLVRDGRAYVAHVGDSRCYLFREGRLERQTQDHSLVDEQVRLGQMTPAEAEQSPFRNVITRAIGTRSTVVSDIGEVPTQPGDIFLLCSDGLTRELSDQRLAELLSAEQEDMQTLCSRLISEANAAGGHDNITCLLVKIAA